MLCSGTRPITRLRAGGTGLSPVDPCGEQPATLASSSAAKSDLKITRGSGRRCRANECAARPIVLVDLECYEGVSGRSNFRTVREDGSPGAGSERRGHYRARCGRVIVAAAALTLVGRLHADRQTHGSPTGAARRGRVLIPTHDAVRRRAAG
jgi:hypothetical protein